MIFLKAERGPKGDALDIPGSCKLKEKEKIIMNLTLEMIQDAQKALEGIARRTPMDSAPKIGKNLYIKAENLQLTGAFKIRGAYNKIRSLTKEEADRGVIACSAGNHAQGIAPVSYTHLVHLVKGWAIGAYALVGLVLLVCARRR